MNIKENNLQSSDNNPYQSDYGELPLQQQELSNQSRILYTDSLEPNYPMGTQQTQYTMQTHESAKKLSRLEGSSTNDQSGFKSMKL